MKEPGMKRLLLLLLFGCAPAPARHHTPAWVSETGSGAPPSAAVSATPATPATSGPTTTQVQVQAASSTFADRYREPVHRIIAAARADRGAYQKLTYLTDRIGHRLSGSQALTR